MIGAEAVLDRVAWFAFVVLVPVLWIGGLRLFLRSGLTRRRKVIWTLVLVGVGAAIGAMLPLAGIRDRFFVVLVLLPILAWADVKIARSNRGFMFWARACSFEVSTVFACAALTRLALGGP
jgi:hypothetical protein